MPTCDNCVKSGLPILLTRYAAVPEDIALPFPDGIGGARVKDVPLTQHGYALRTLREGYVYLFYTKGPRGHNYWEIYRVAENGSLWIQTQPLPLVNTGAPSCARHASTAPVDVIAIKQPEKCGTVFIAFSEHVWSDATFDQYKDNVAMRSQRMQSIEPAKWAGSPMGGHAIKATVSTVSASVLEYNAKLNAKRYTEYARVGIGDDGAFDASKVTREVTRYPVYMRTQVAELVRNSTFGSATVAGGKASNDADALIGEMNSVGMSDGKVKYPPMLMALWDAIGVAHELNGFRNDVTVAVKRYCDEQSLRVAALHDVDIAKTAIEHGATDPYEKFKKANDKGYKVQFEGKIARLRKDLVEQSGQDQTQTKYLIKQFEYLVANDDYDWYAPDEDVNSEAAFAAWKKHEDAARKFRENVRSKEMSELQDSAWGKYEKYLDGKKISAFRKDYANLQKMAYSLQEDRSDDVSAWLQAPLFVDTLDDYSPKDLRDGIAFATVIADGVFGLNSTPKGKLTIDKLVANTKPTDRFSIVWRAVALNMDEGKPELESALKVAESDRKTPLKQGVAIVAGVAGDLKKLTGFYDKMAKLLDKGDTSGLTPTSLFLKQEGMDRLVTSTGDSIFARFRVNQLADFVGEKIIQHVFLRRAGVSDVDALMLVKKQALLEDLSRAQTLERLRTARSFIEGEKAIGTSPATSELREAWGQIKVSEVGQSTLRAGRIATVLVFLNAVSFYKLATAGNLDGAAKAKLTASGAALASSVITVGMLPYQAVLKTSMTAQTWKLAGGALGAMAALIVGWGDLAEANNRRESEHYGEAAYYYAIAFVELGSGSAILISSLSAAAPLFKKIALRWGSDAIVAGVEEVSARVAAVAALRIVGFLAGWEVTVVVVVAQVIYWYFSDDDLQTWCRRSMFALDVDAKTPYGNVSSEQKAFEQALTAVE